MKPSFQYFWWDLEKSRFKGVLYNTIGGFWLNQHPYKTWEEFQTDLPHMAYTHLVQIRFDALEQLFVDLRVINQMLGISSIPAKSSVMDINRHDWLKAIHDLCLYRFSSIRDVIFQLVNELYELKIRNLDLGLKTIRNGIGGRHSDVVAKLEIIAATGPDIRDDRNIRAHRGFLDLEIDDESIFRAMSWSEGYGSSIVDYDIDGKYQIACKKLYERFVPHANDLCAQATDLVDAMISEFDARYEEKYRTRRQQSQR